MPRGFTDTAALDILAPRHFGTKLFELYSMPTVAAVCAEMRCAGLTRFAQNQHATGGAEVSVKQFGTSAEHESVRAAIGSS